MGIGELGIWGKRRIPGYGRYPARPGVRVLAGRLGLRRRNGRGSMTLPCPAGKGALSVCGSDAVCPVGAKALRGNTPDPGGLTGRRDLWGTICPSGTAAGAPGYGRPFHCPRFCGHRPAHGKAVRACRSCDVHPSPSFPPAGKREIAPLYLQNNTPARGEAALRPHFPRRKTSAVSPASFPAIPNARISNAPCGRRNFPFLPQPPLPRGHPAGERGLCPRPLKGLIP